MRAPETIDEAEAHGWRGIEAHCQTCGSTIVQWPLLRRVTPRLRLADIAARLTCRRCGAPPERVSLWVLVGGAGAPATVLSDLLIRPPYQRPPASRRG